MKNCIKKRIYPFLFSLKIDTADILLLFITINGDRISFGKATAAN